MSTADSTLARDAEELCMRLGELVVRWNSAEVIAGLLLHKAVGANQPGYRIEVLTAHLGNVAVSEALTAIADDHESPLKEHLKHAAKLLNSYREHRNHFVHAPLEFATRENEEGVEIPIAFTQTISSKGGALTLSQGEIQVSQLVDFIEKLQIFRTYTGSLLSAMYGLPDCAPLSVIEKPPLLKKLAKDKFNLIEYERQRRELRP